MPSRHRATAVVRSDRGRKRTRYLGATERAVGQGSAIFAGKAYTLCHTLVDDVYAKFMTSNPLIKTVSYVNYAFILIHIVWALLLTSHNLESPRSGRICRQQELVSVDSSNMGILGTFILIFLVIHLQGFLGRRCTGVVFL